MTRKYWSEDEINFVKNNISKTNKELGLLLNRSESSVESFICNNKLREMATYSAKDVIKDIEIIERYNKDNRYYYKYRCKCNKEKTCRAADILNYCICTHKTKAKTTKEPYIREIKSCPIGYRYNYLTVIGKSVMEDGKNKGLYLCDCGKIVRMERQSVITGITKSCGCYNRIAASQRMSAYNQKYYSPTHNSLYSSFTRMKWFARRYNFTVQEGWYNWDVFYEWSVNNGWEEGLVLSRKDLSGGFNEDNCIFTTKAYIINQHQNISKGKATSLERYGYTSYTKTQEFLERIIKTNIARYGFPYTTQVPQFKIKMRDTCVKKYGVPYMTRTNLAEQNSVREYLLSIGHKFDSNWLVLKGKEIDLYNETLKIGIEYCGLYWHSESKRGKHSHYFKYQECKKQGIRLITIFSDEWQYRRKQVESYLSNLLGIQSTRLFARKCECRKIPSDDAKNFVERYHIQGQTRKSKVAFGLFYNNELVGTLSLNPHHRNSSDIVLDRMCFAAGTFVVGGASRLIKIAKMWCRKHGYKKIISWSDNRWSEGHVYEATGFILEKELGPDYSYISKNKKIRISKQKCKKENINCPNNLTEYEYMQKLGYDRIWDCGKKRYVCDL